MREQNFNQATQSSLSGDAQVSPLPAEDALTDPALDRLLSRAQAPVLRAGFADRVLHSVCATPGRFGTAPLKMLLCAAAFVLCAGAVLWKNTPRETPPAQAPNLEEDRLIAALRSPGLSGDDLALVANLREVLEAELIANHPLWLDEK